VKTKMPVDVNVFEVTVPKSRPPVGEFIVVVPSTVTVVAVEPRLSVPPVMLRFPPISGLPCSVFMPEPEIVRLLYVKLLTFCAAPLKLTVPVPQVKVPVFV